MSLNDEERRIMVGLEYDKALYIINQIDGLQSLGYWDNIANRLYYALFHAVSALLINDKHTVNTHRGVIAIFGQHYVRTGKFDVSDGKLYSQLQSMREKGDYNCIYQTSEDEVIPMIAPVKALIDKIGQYIDAEA